MINLKNDGVTIFLSAIVVLAAVLGILVHMTFAEPYRPQEKAVYYTESEPDTAYTMPEEEIRTQDGIPEDPAYPADDQFFNIKDKG